MSSTLTGAQFFNELAQQLQNRSLELTEDQRQLATIISNLFTSRLGQPAVTTCASTSEQLLRVLEEQHLYAEARYVQAKAQKWIDLVDFLKPLNTAHRIPKTTFAKIFDRVCRAGTLDTAVLSGRMCRWWNRRKAPDEEAVRLKYVQGWIKRVRLQVGDALRHVIELIGNDAWRSRQEAVSTLTPFGMTVEELYIQSTQQSLIQQTPTRDAWMAGQFGDMEDDVFSIEKGSLCVFLLYRMMQLY